MDEMDLDQMKFQMRFDSVGWNRVRWDKMKWNGNEKGQDDETRHD